MNDKEAVLTPLEIKLTETLKELKEEILRCRKKEISMSGAVYGAIDASQVYRLHAKVEKLNII